MEFSHRLELFGPEIFAALNDKKVALEAEGISYNIKNVSSDYLRRRVLPVLPLLFVSGLARGNLGRYIVIPLRCNRRACRCLKLLALSSASRKPSSTCSLHIPLSL